MSGRQVRAPVHHDVALPAFPLAYVVEHRNPCRGLHDPPEAPAERGAKFGQPEGQAAVRQCAVLRTIVAIDAPEVGREIARRTFGAARRRCRIVFPAAALDQLALARFCRLQQGETKFPIGDERLLSLCGQRRNPAIRRIDDPRRTRPRVFRGREHCQVISAGELAIGGAPAEQCRSLFVQFFPLRLGEKFLVRILGRTL